MHDTQMGGGQLCELPLILMKSSKEQSTQLLTTTQSSTIYNQGNDTKIKSGNGQLAINSLLYLEYVANILRGKTPWKKPL